MITLAFTLAVALSLLGLAFSPAKTLEALVGVTAIYLALDFLGYPVRWLAVFYAVEALAFAVSVAASSAKQFYSVSQ